MPEAKAIKTHQYLSVAEIEKNLENLEYIIMAAPAPDHFKKTPIHFTIFLNTQEELPHEVKLPVLEKFMSQYKIKDASEVMSQLMPVGFASTDEKTPMPMLLVQPNDMKTIPSMAMHVIDFLGDSDNFDEAKVDSLTGWSYAYETNS